MSRLVQAGKKNPVVRTKAAELSQTLPQKSYIGEIANLFDYVQNGIRYIRDPREVEMLHAPEQIILQEWGDCDDKCVLLASLLESIGHPTRFVAIGTKPNTYQHVFVATRVGSKWMALDPTEPQPMGWKPPNVAAVMVKDN